MPLLPIAASKSTRLRFDVGSRVECFTGEWHPGTVIKLWYTQASFEAGMCAPYQVELDKGNIIFVPEDSNRCIRATDKEDVDPRYSVPMPPEDGPYPTLRFGHGQRVICNVGSRWEKGVVEEMFWRGSVRPAIPTGKCAPYQVLLDGDEGALVCAPFDGDAAIQVSPAPKPTRSGPVRKGPAGCIDPMMPPIIKAEAYVDLILAPDGETMLQGEPAIINSLLGQRGFDGPLLGCTSEELEMVSAVVGLARIGQTAVRVAMLRRAPESLAALAAFMAFTPELIEKDDDEKDGWSYEGCLKDPMSRDPDDLRVRRCEFTSRHPSGRGPPYKCKESHLPLAPPQASECYGRVMTACLNVLLTLSEPHEPGATQAVAQLQASPAFVPLVQRLMELVARGGEAGCLSTAASLPSGRAPSPGNSLGYGACVPRLALWVLARQCGSPAAPRVRWLLRAHAAHERHFDVQQQQWLPAPPRTAGAPPSGFLGVLFSAMLGNLDGASESARQDARVLLAVTQGQPCGLADDQGRPLLPPLPPLVESVEEIEEAFDALAADQPDHEALTDELAACADEAERAAAKLFLLDARLLPPGRRLCVRGLASKAELNGREAILAGPRPPGKLRYPVRMLSDGHDTPAMLMRPRNMRLVGDD